MLIRKVSIGEIDISTRNHEIVENNLLLGSKPLPNFRVGLVIRGTSPIVQLSAPAHSLYTRFRGTIVQRRRATTVSVVMEVETCVGYGIRRQLAGFCRNRISLEVPGTWSPCALPTHTFSVAKGDGSTSPCSS